MSPWKGRRKSFSKIWCSGLSLACSSPHSPHWVILRDKCYWTRCIDVVMRQGDLERVHSKRIKGSDLLFVEPLASLIRDCSWALCSSKALWSSFQPLSAASCEQKPSHQAQKPLKIWRRDYSLAFSVDWSSPNECIWPHTLPIILNASSLPILPEFYRNDQGISAVLLKQRFSEKRLLISAICKALNLEFVHSVVLSLFPRKPDGG